MKYHKWMNEYNKRNHSIFLCCEIYKDLYLKSFNCISKRYLPSYHGNGNCSCNHCPFYEKLDNFFKYFREIGGLKMRKILFRGKRIDNGEWEYGGCVFTENKVCLIYNQTHSIDLQGCTVEENSVGQYTGWTDKNGTRVFEGDIVRYNDTIHKVIFCTINGSAFFGITMPERGEIWNFDGITCANKMEVIGNIHDNPKLLNNFKNQ